MLPWNADAEHYALTRNLRIEGTTGEGTSAAAAGYVQQVGTATGETFEQWLAATRYEEGVDYGGYTAYQLFGQVTRAGGTSSTYDPFTGWVGGGSIDPTDPTDPTDDVDIRKNLRDDFYMALRGVGIPDAMLDSLWTEMEGLLTNDPSMTAQRLLLGMYESDAFAERFPAIVALKAGGAAPRNVPTPGDYIRFEKAVSKELKRVGFIEPNFNNLITQLYTNSVGLDEVTERLDMAQKVMWEMPQAVRDKLADWFGDASATSISMKTFLDPADDWARVQDDISTAQTGGWGQMVAGLGDWNETLAKRVADTGLSQRDQWLRFTELKAQEMLFQENIGETRDLDYAKHGVEAAFDLDSDLVETIERRATGRSARFSGGGGAMLSGTTTGFGAANA
jgi:hypothetical protein